MTAIRVYRDLNNIRFFITGKRAIGKATICAGTRITVKFMLLFDDGKVWTRSPSVTTAAFLLSTRKFYGEI
jgi:uncharacterized membrane-anchored protein YitT (DUF2179 family)